jgi:hypothetical protein
MKSNIIIMLVWVLVFPNNILAQSNRMENKMITTVGSYFLEQKVTDAVGLTEFTSEEYTTADLVGMPRVLEDEKMFHGSNTSFASWDWDTMIGTTKGVIYKIVLQSFCANKEQAKSVLNMVKEFISRKIGKYNEHALMSDKYIWDRPEGNIILYRMSKFDIYSINVFFTSSCIKEQMLKIIEKK